jgi:RND family efflux transporter MFP subunit
MNRAVFLVPLALLAGCPGPSEDGQVAEPVALVSVGQAEPGTVAETVRLYGAVESGAAGRYVLSAPLDASVTAIDAPPGAAVRRGQVVLRLAASPASALELAKASADAQAASESYARARRLRADGLVGDAEVESARAAATDAEAARSSLAGRTTALVLRSPADGYVETLPATPGDLVTAGSVIATIAALGDLRARFGVDPSIARRARVGASLKILPAGGLKPFEVPIVSVSPVVDPQTRLASIFASIPAATGIGVGESLAAEVAIASATDVLTIPYAAVLDDGGQPYVFVVRDGVAHRQDVVTGATSDERIAILGGLESGDQVVTEGGTALDDGMQVRLK